jgi:hypothetical protein
MTQPLGTENLGAYWFGGGAKAQGSFDLSLEGNVSDSTSYMSANPGANDTIGWTCATEVRGGQAATWAVTNPDGASDYAMLVSTGSADIPVVAGGSASLLINHTTMPAGPFPMGTGGSMTANLPASVPPSVYTQAVAYSGALAPANTTAASNGMKSVN